jgi:hypothetical protein
MKAHTARVITPMIALVAACASAPSAPPAGGPRGLRASEHLEAARQHDDVALYQPDATAMQAPPGTATTVWRRTWETSTEQKRLADIHRSIAAALQSEYEQACGSRPLDQVAVSPLERHAIGGWPTSTGMILYLDPRAGAPDKVLADLRCHRAWMMLAPSPMEDCVLDLPGIVLDVHGERDVIALSIVVRDRRLLDELHRRAAHALEEH